MTKDIFGWKFFKYMLTLFDPKMLAHPGDHEKRKKLGGRSAAPPPSPVLKRSKYARSNRVK